MGGGGGGAGRQGGCQRWGILIAFTGEGGGGSRRQQNGVKGWGRQSLGGWVLKLWKGGKGLTAGYNKKTKGETRKCVY